MELLQHGHLPLHGDVHVILHRVQGSQDKVEYADGWSVCVCACMCVCVHTEEHIGEDSTECIGVVCEHSRT